MMINYFLAIIAILIGLATNSVLAATTKMTDPTRPPGTIFAPQTYSATEPSELTAVFIYPTYRLAIINKQMVKIGDQVGEFSVTSINAYSVELTGPEKNKVVLQLTTYVKSGNK
jgi:hypothetical protein